VVPVADDGLVAPQTVQRRHDRAGQPDILEQVRLVAIDRAADDMIDDRQILGSQRGSVFVDGEGTVVEERVPGGDAVGPGRLGLDSRRPARRRARL
jgi:hypothetical protein